jgi:FdhD protein
VEECPVALVYDGTTAAVLMATPANLAGLARGFSLTEGIIGDIGEIEELSVVPGPDGIELRLWLRPDAGRRLKERRRLLVGPTGCGLCGIDSLREAGRIVPPVEHPSCLAPEQIGKALSALTESQILNHATHAMHAAGFFAGQTARAWSFARTWVATTRSTSSPAHSPSREWPGALAPSSSQAGYRSVQKTAAIGAGIVVGMSAPTALAIRTAEATGITLIGIARGKEFEIFSHPERICP